MSFTIALRVLAESRCHAVTTFCKSGSTVPDTVPPTVESVDFPLVSRGCSGPVAAIPPLTIAAAGNSDLFGRVRPSFFSFETSQLPTFGW